MRALWANVRRRPDGPAEITADLVRLVVLPCIVVAGIGWGVQGALSLAFIGLVMLLPRALDVRPGFDIAFGILALVSVWSSVTDLYVTVKWWDLPMHFAVTGLGAALLYLILVRFGIVADHLTLPHPRLSAAVVTAALGTSLAALWEMWEWVAKNYIDETTYVGYTDSIGDLVWGLIGSVLAGLAMPWFAARPRRSRADHGAATSGSSSATDGPPSRSTR
jgi:hypothetical protein